MKSTGDFTFKIRARAVRHVIAITRELPLEQWLTFINRTNPRKTYSNLFGHGYTIDLYNSPVSLGRAVCNRNEAFKNTEWSRRRRHQADDTSLAYRRSSTARISTGSREIARASHFMRRGWGRLWYLSSKLRGNMATRTGIALDSNFDLHLVSNILIAKSQICPNHVIIGINHGWVCVVDINSRVCCLAGITRRGETTHSGVDVNNTHPSMINPLNKPSLVQLIVCRLVGAKPP